MILNERPTAAHPCRSGRAKLRAVALGASFLFAFPAVAFAQQLVTANDLDEIKNLLSGFGSVTQETDEDNDPRFVGRIAGKAYRLAFYGCDDDNTNCDDVQFITWLAAEDYDASLQRVNDYNQSKRFGNASIDEDGDIRVTYLVNLRYGITSKTMDDNIDWWRIILKESEEFFAKS